MPTNFSDSLNPLVVLKSGDQCSLKRHFTGCARQVAGYLDLLAKKDPDRLVWISVPAIQKHCKNYDKKVNGVPTGYSRSMIDKVLKCFRDEAILSKRAAIDLQERRGFRVSEAFVFAPHEAFTVLEGSICRWVGMGRVPGTTWQAAPGGGVWFRAKGRSGEIPATIQFTVGPGTAPITAPITEPVTSVITEPITAPITAQNAKSYSDGYAGTAAEATEITHNSAGDAKVFPKSAGPNLTSLCKSVSPMSPTNPHNQPNPDNGATPEQTSEAVDLSRWLTDRQRHVTPRPKGILLADFVRDVGDEFLIPKLTAGLIATDEVSRWQGRNLRTKQNDCATKEQLISVCRSLADRHGSTPIRTERDLGDFLVRVMDEVKITGKKIPVSLFATMKRLQRSDDAVKTETPLPGSGTGGGCYHRLLDYALRYAGIDVDANSEELHEFDLLLRLHERNVGSITGCTTGWELLHKLLSEREDQPACLITLRDFFWDRDTKRAATPPWKPVPPVS